MSTHRGTLESESRKRLRKNRIEQVMLSCLIVAGGIGVAIVAPNVLKLLKQVDPDWLHKRDPRQRLYETASRLKRKGLVMFTLEGGRTRMKITPKGRSFLDAYVKAGALG